MNLLKIKKEKAKVFCIGSGKTGTTSVEVALKDLGYRLGDQIEGELLIDAYIDRDFDKIVKFSKSADAFQDAPFCFQHTFIALDQYFNDAKFILTERNSDEQWYNSLVNFHSKKLTDGKIVPTWEDLKSSDYRYKGYQAKVRNKVFGIEENEDPYNEIKLKEYYNTHNHSVKNYFRNKRNLLTINVAESSSYKNLCDFLEKKPLYDKFPWENKT